MSNLEPDVRRRGKNGQHIGNVTRRCKIKRICRGGAKS